MNDYRRARLRLSVARRVYRLSGGSRSSHRLAVVSHAASLKPRGRPQGMATRSYCTFAATDAAPVSVSVQLLVSFPLLEQAPDQIASRPFETVSVIDVPIVNGADPVLPTATLIPTGLDVTLSPLRPVAVTVSVAVAAGGVTVNAAVRVTPAALAVM